MESTPLWTDALARRHRALLKSGPLHRLREHAARHAAVRAHDDPVALALKAIEGLVDVLGLEAGLPRATLIASMASLAAAIDRANGVEPSAERHAALGEIVLGALLNDADRRHAFAEPYLDASPTERGERGERGEVGEVSVVARTTTFRIASEQEAIDGRVVVRVEADGVNLFLRSLDVELEDAQAATEAAMQAQLARGRLDLALATAREAQIRSIQYDEKLRAHLRRTRRDVGRVDWRAAVPALLDEARLHLRGRLDTERALEDAAQGQLDRVAGTPASEALVRILAMLRDCFARHEALHGELMRAHQTFRDEQARQRFSPVPLAAICAPEHDLLRPTLALGRDAALDVVDPFALALTPARPPLLMDLSRLWERLLKTRHAARDSVDVEEPSPLDRLIAPPPRFSDEAFARVGDLLSALGEPTSLGALLSRVDDPTDAHLLTLRSLQCFATGGDRRVTAEGYREALDDARFEGDDLILSPAATDAA